MYTYNRNECMPVYNILYYTYIKLPSFFYNHELKYHHLIFCIPSANTVFNIIPSINGPSVYLQKIKYNQWQQVVR